MTCSSIHRLWPLIYCLLAPALVFVPWCNNLPAASYDFVEHPSGDILATLHTDSSDPFDHTNVIGLSFTSEGDALLGIGVGTYPNSFDQTSNLWMSDGIGGLSTVSGLEDYIYSFNAPPSQILFDLNNGSASTVILQLAVNPSSFDSIDLSDGTLPEFIHITGQWQLVPEPASILLVTPGLMMILGHRARRRLS